MKAKTFCCLAVLIFLLSNLSYSQSTDSGFPKSKSCYATMKELSGDEQKSNLVLSLSGGYAGLFKESSRPNGFNIQADLLYPVSKFFAMNFSFNYVQFPGYRTQSRIQINDSTINTLTANRGVLYHINMTSGISFGNINRDSKLNYYLTAGLGIGYSILGNSINSNSINNSVFSEVKYKTETIFIIGAFTSGRFSYKIAEKYRIFIEPSVYTWTLDGEDNYHINGGISINL
jgi:hypothetical protein